MVEAQRLAGLYVLMSGGAMTRGEHTRRLGLAKGAAQGRQCLLLAREGKRKLGIERGAAARDPALPRQIRADLTQSAYRLFRQGARRRSLHVEAGKRRAQPCLVVKHRAKPRCLSVTPRRRQRDERAGINAPHPKARALRRIVSAKRIAAATAR